MGSIPSRLILFATLIPALTRSSSVDARPDPAARIPIGDDKAMASQLVDRGIAAQDAAEYDKAIELYTRAYDLRPHPSLLFNIGQAHRLAGRLQEARRFYERYLSAAPGGVEAARARALLAAMPEAVRTEPPLAIENTLRSSTNIWISTAPASATSSTPPQTDEAARPGRALRIAGITAGGIGLACAAASLAFGLEAKSIEEEQRLKAPWFDLERVREGEAAERHHLVALAASGTFIAAGAVMYWMGRRQGRGTRRAAWTPTLGPGAAGIALSAVFP